MTGRELARLKDLLLKLYEDYHSELSPAEEEAITRTRDLAYQKEDEL